MKIAFVGKGGSGKTTLSSLFARHLALQGFPVLAIDADINQHLGRALGLSHEETKAVPSLDDHADSIRAYLRGSNSRIAEPNHVMKTTPPGMGSRLLRFNDTSSPLFSIATHADGVKLVATGPLDEEDLGIACFHGKTGIVEAILNHFADSRNEYVIVDMTAGADSFSSGLFSKFDVTFLVVEPTEKSLDVFRQFKEQSASYDVLLQVIGNKVESEEDEQFLREHVGEFLLGSLGRSAFIRKADKGEFLPLSQFELANAETLLRMQKAVDETPQNWERFYQQTVEFHRLNARAWMSARTGIDLESQIDPEFNLKEYIMKGGEVE